MMGGIGMFELVWLLLIWLIPIIILYFVIKFAIKHAIKELKQEGIIPNFNDDSNGDQIK